MELALSLGETQKPFSFLHKSHMNMNMMLKKTDLGFCMGSQTISEEERERSQESSDENRKREKKEEMKRGIWSTSSESDHHHHHNNNHPLQLDLLPFSPVPLNQHSPSPADRIPFPWLTQNLISEPGKGTSLNGKLLPPEEAEELSSPNSGASSFQMDYSLYRSGRNNNKRDLEGIANEVEIERGGSSRGSDDEDSNGLTRKKLRLTKDQSAFLEESFKEHNTLNPKQKQALAKQLNLRPRQVEVWFQNRRARTKLKQTEVDCEYLKRCCETLTEENKRLQKELQELRALKSSQPFYMHLPATTLTMCPSCERVATTTTAPTTTTTATVTAATTTTATNTTMSLATPKLHPFLRAQANAQEAST